MAVYGSSHLRADYGSLQKFISFKQFTAVQSSSQLQAVHSSVGDIGADGYGWDYAKYLVEFMHNNPQRHRQQSTAVYGSSCSP